MSKNLQPAFAKLDAFVRKKMIAENIPGLILAVTDRDRLLWRKEYGYANIDSRKHVDRSTLFQIGSISKSFASIALLQLVDEGKVDLHRPVKSYLPWIEIRSRFAPITLHHLLTHTAGIPIGAECTPEGKAEIGSLREFGASVKPGEFYHYSNVGYKIVGEVISKLRGKSLPRVLQERVIRPLGMKSTASEITNDIRSRTAVGYWPLYDDRPMNKKTEWVPCTWKESDTADGSISSTSEDMCNYIRMLMNRGKFSGGRLISDESYTMLVNKWKDASASGRKEHYGYGIAVEPYHGHSLMSHGGGMLGYLSYLRFDAVENVGTFASTSCWHPVDDVTRLAIELVRRSRHGEGLSGAELAVIPAQPRLKDYTGTYTSASHFLEVREKAGALTARLGSELVALERLDADNFYSDHPSLERFVFAFGRQNGKVVEVTHGEDWFTNSRFKGRRADSYPKEWDALTGHYRSHNPWNTSIRVIVVKGSLHLITQYAPAEPLTPLGNKLFRVGKDHRSPERLSFSEFVEGKAQLATFSGCDLARSFTP